jgi:plastocyanin
MTKSTMSICTAAIASLFAVVALATWTTGHLTVREAHASGVSARPESAQADSGLTQGRAAPSKLRGAVGPSETISLKTATGKRVSMVGRGTYAITVTDRSDEHNFYISGPGVRKQITSVGFVGTKTVTVKLRSGKYAFVCTPHSDDMRGAFTVR